MTAPHRLQQLVSLNRLLGNLFAVRLVRASDMFAYLHLLISLGHDMRDPETNTADGTAEFFRVNLATAILEPVISALDQSWRGRLQDYLALFRCYICSKTGLPEEYIEIVSSIFKKADCALNPLASSAAIADFEKCPGASLFLGRLDYLLGYTAVSSLGGAECLVPEDTIDPSEQLAELDREMSRLIGLGLDSRRLERRPQMFEATVPINAPQASLSSMSILMKKKKKTMLKPIISLDGQRTESNTSPKPLAGEKSPKTTYLLQSLTNSNYKDYLNH